MKDHIFNISREEIHKKLNLKEKKLRPLKGKESFFIDTVCFLVIVNMETLTQGIKGTIISRVIYYFYYHIMFKAYRRR